MEIKFQELFLLKMPVLLSNNAVHCPTFMIRMCALLAHKCILVFQDLLACVFKCSAQKQKFPKALCYHFFCLVEFMTTTLSSVLYFCLNVDETAQ